MWTKVVFIHMDAISIYQRDMRTRTHFICIGMHFDYVCHLTITNNGFHKGGRAAPLWRRPKAASIMCAGEAAKTCININKHALHMYIYAYILYIPVLSLIYPLWMNFRQTTRFRCEFSPENSNLGWIVVRKPHLRWIIVRKHSSENWS